jgi:nucleoside-diphosphate-sugar epimerase
MASSKGLVLVTGANGYIAARTVEAFLQAGYSVRGTVRSLKSAAAMTQALAAYGDRLSFAEVPDITTPGAFDAALDGVVAVAHLASPVSLHFTDPEPVLRTARQGTIGVLESAARTPTVKSFVFVSSIVAIQGSFEEPRLFTEADWNDTPLKLVAELGKDSPGPLIYAASKVEAEKALWKFRDEHKPSFTMTSVNPV